MKHERCKRILAIATVCFILFAGCEKKDDESIKPGVVYSLNDTIISPTVSQNVAFTTGRYDLDLDDDQEVDLCFLSMIYSLGRTVVRDLSVMPKNNFEIVIQKSLKNTLSSYNTGGGYINNSYSSEINIPAILSINDTISDDLTYTSDSIELSCYNHDSFGGGTTNVTTSQWIGKDDAYIGFRNKEKKIVGWVKIGVADYDEAVLRSYLFTRNKESLVIQE
ncbi:MAG TPA: hypothetical protein PKH79_05280 [Prolixibacteraceae bacterium]|nr:hypothetical protein [Prolixibacteraceae bacterium]